MEPRLSMQCNEFLNVFFCIYSFYCDLQIGVGAPRRNASEQVRAKVTKPVRHVMCTTTEGGADLRWQEITNTPGRGLWCREHCWPHPRPRVVTGIHSVNI